MERYRIGSDCGLYFVTMSVVEWLPVFVSEAACKIVIDSLRYCHDHKRLRVHAYVIMPTHFHAIVLGETFDPDSLKAALVDFRKFTGNRLCDFCAHHMPPCFDQTLQRAAGADRIRTFWQRSLHPESIETERFLVQKRDYLHDNPCRKGLVTRPEYWRFSSASYWLSEGQAQTDLILSAIDW